MHVNTHTKWVLDSKQSLRGINQEPVNRTHHFCLAVVFVHHSAIAVFAGLLQNENELYSQGYPQIQPADGELFQRVLGTLTGGLLGVLLIVHLWAAVRLHCRAVVLGPLI